MQRKRITQVFPFLLQLRRAQRRLCFYLRMYLDRNRYARTKATTKRLACIYEAKSLLLNEKTGFDIVYQKNKMFNLHLAARPVNGILIRPQETFSFWLLVKNAGKKTRYKEGLSIENGNLVTVAGGGLCQLSNFLFWMFIHTPLTIMERHPHHIKDFPSQDQCQPDGVDATISEGWLDLKVKNQTDQAFQIELSFDETYLYGRILSDRAMQYRYDILNRDKSFYRKDERIFERVSVCRQTIRVKTNEIESEQLLYTDVFEIGYPLPEGTLIESRKALLYE